ncbi:Acetyltransferase (GNAT) domain-containing protein [Clostridium cavendishii DSM 21758]|uniref:Acetyltransferase (GNAT) domain-containing protein n=1 Tax=Clostridium cavendishii DSM 21758 TaxID=1121302 RepID=A0A1M6I8P0_9CLOT|nr:GNAT family N-acetyltransferase [Clostridium cavendishii]SHJ30840.1 Acetyltransferase (GNAT) domain-containing protein [Clostridium cavendishii DSM 21758]
MQNLNLKYGYMVKQLFKTENRIVEELCEKCSDYYILHDGIVPSKEEIDEVFTALPPNKNYEDKFVLGIYKFDELVGIVDIIKDYHISGEWMIGLMMIELKERRNGLGRMVHEALIAWATSFRIGVIEDNYNGIKFWSALGYTKIKEVNMKFKIKTHIVDVMRLKF